MLTRTTITAARACRMQIRRLSGSQTLHKGFPLTGPTWSAKKLLENPQGINRHHELEKELNQHDIAHLHSLSGLTMPDPAKDPEAFKQVMTEINQLRDFLSHIQVVSESEDLESIEPLVRIAEPVNFTASDLEGGLKFANDKAAHVGQSSLRMAEQKSGHFFIVEE